MFLVKNFGQFRFSTHPPRPVQPSETNEKTSLELFADEASVPLCTYLYVFISNGTFCSPFMNKNDDNLALYGSATWVIAGKLITAAAEE